jgi:hypothetical protein
VLQKVSHYIETAFILPVMKTEAVVKILQHKLSSGLDEIPDYVVRQ